MWMNRKGQALVEFVIILPVFLMILFAIVDFGNLLYLKNQLQNQSTDIIGMLRNGSSVLEIEKEYSELKITVSEYKDNYQKVVVGREVDLITPVLDRFLGDPCSISVERIIPDV